MINTAQAIEALSLPTLEAGEHDRILLTVSGTNTAQYLAGLETLGADIVSRSLGVKTTRGSSIEADDASQYISVEDLVIDAGRAGANYVEVDTRFGGDGSELISEIDILIENLSLQTILAVEARQRKLDERERHYQSDGGYIITNRMERINTLIEMRRQKHEQVDEKIAAGILPPLFISVAISSNTDSDELRVAQEHAAKQGVVLVGFVGTSKKSEKKFKYEGTTAVAETVRHSKIAIAGGLRHLQMACVVAPAVLDDLSSSSTDVDIGELTINGTGGYTGDYSQSDHEQSIAIEDTEGVDVFVQGASILLADNPIQAYADHVNAYKSN
jgi:hypothetical protein